MTDCNNYSDWYSWIEKRVCAKDNLYGTLRYFGNTHFSNGLWCGIELDSPLGKNDGMVNNVRYFNCNSNFGIFIHVSKVRKLKDFSKENLNETFQVDNSFKKQEVELNSAISDSKTVEEKLSNSGLGSTESLGILSFDLIDHDSSWEDFKLNCSLNDIFSNHQNMMENDKSNFLKPVPVPEKEMYDGISNPKYASTPRVPKKKIVADENDSDDSLGAKNHLIEKFTFDIHCQETPEFFFDIDKLKNSEQLTSTHKNLSGLATILKNSELSSSLLGNENTQHSVNLEKTKFLKESKFFQNSNEILGKTFELHNSSNSPTLSEKEYEKVFRDKNELNVTTIIKDKKSVNLSVKKSNPNATFDFQCPNTLEKISFEETKDMSFDLKENVTVNLISDAFNKNELNTTSVAQNFNGNATFELSPIQKRILNEEKENTSFNSKEIDMENLSNFNECGAVTVSNENELLLEKTFVFDLSTIHECEDSTIQNEAFTYKSKFLKETGSFENSSTQLNYRNSICLPPSFCNELQKSVRRTSSVSSYPSSKEKKKEVTGRKSFINKGSVSSLRDLHGKANVFKKPLSQNSTLRNSKAVLKFPTVNSKENRNKTIKESSFSSNTFSKSTNNKTSINTEYKKNEIAFKPKQIKTFNKDNMPGNLTLKSCNLKKSLPSKTVSNLALPIKNKLNCDNLKQSSNVASKISTKTMPVSKIARNDIQIPTVTKFVHEDLIKDDIKNTKSQLKMKDLENKFISKNSNFGFLQNSNICAPSILGKLTIPKRNSLVPGFEDKPSVGVVKPRYSMHLAKSNEVLERRKINYSLKECSEVNSSKISPNVRQSTGLAKKIKTQVLSPCNSKPGLKQPLKKIGIPTGLKIPRFLQNVKKN